MIFLLCTVVGSEALVDMVTVIVPPVLVPIVQYCVGFDPPSPQPKESAAAGRRRRV
jgi:hypothetical protein